MKSLFSTTVWEHQFYALMVSESSCLGPEGYSHVHCDQASKDLSKDLNEHLSKKPISSTFMLPPLKDKPAIWSGDLWAIVMTPKAQL